MNRAVAAIVVVVILIIGGLALANKDNNKKNTPATNTNTSSSNQNQTTPANNSSNNQNSTDQNQASTITYGNNGFSPGTLTVKAGTIITIKNASSSSLQFSSDPHPIHTDDPELNMGVLSPGQSQTLTVTKTGTHGYHNHLNPGDTGTLIVQ